MTFASEKESSHPIDPEKILISISERLQSLESKTATLTTHLEEVQSRLDQVLSKQKMETTEITTPPTEHLGSPIIGLQESRDLDSLSNQNDELSNFRKGLMFFRTEKLSESILALTEFIEKNPDHPLAGSAQFYIGESYFKQKEYRLAIQEYSQVLIAYEHSVHISDTLSRLAFAEDALKRPKESAHYRQLLTSIFPQSPAAGETSNPTDTHRPTLPGPSTLPPANSPTTSLNQSPPTAPSQIEELREKSNPGLSNLNSGKSKI